MQTGRRGFLKLLGIAPVAVPDVLKEAETEEELDMLEEDEIFESAADMAPKLRPKFLVDPLCTTDGCLEDHYNSHFY